MPLPPDFKEFIELMISGNVRYVMIGGFAYNLYRNPRATGDIDFYVSNTQENESKLRKVLEAFGFGSTLPPNSTRLLVDGKVLMLGRAPFRIDILTAIDGVSFDEVEFTSRTIEIDSLLVRVISPEMLLRNKQASGRPKDVADAIELENWLRSS
jgi:hypothetical protein